MTEEELKDFSIFEIVQDLKAILDCLQVCTCHKAHASIFQGINPYLISFVYAGYEYLEKQKVIVGIKDKNFKKRVAKLRSKFLKQYRDFNQGTYESLNAFNREEYIKFFRNKYPDLSPFITEEIKNYYIASINRKPIDNYHLSSCIFGCEIGTYIDDITPQIQEFISQMVSFICQILSAAHIKFESRAQEVLFDDVKNIEINLAYGYKNFGIQNNPPILMAFMDILCTVNSYNEVFCKINSDKRLDLKVKYLVFFECVQGIKTLIKFCQDSNIDLNFDKIFVDFIYQIDKSYCRNKLRNYCAHYDYKEGDWVSDPVFEIFEQRLEKPIEVISNELSACLVSLGEMLNKNIIRMP